MIVLRIRPGAAATCALQLKLMASRFPGEHDLVLRVEGRELRLGDRWRYDGSQACLAALGEFGDVEGVTTC